MLIFAHDSDLHYDKDGPRERKKIHPELILGTSARFVIVTGDLTENGYNGKYINFGLFKFRYGGDEDQLTPLKEQYIAPLLDGEKPVYLCAGNHDRGRGFAKIYRYQPVRKYISRRHGSNNYAFEVEGLRFLIMDEYPKKLKWLKRQLKRHSDKPFVIAFHFNLEGSYSDWWSDRAKSKFYDCIKDYNILAILVGHHHVSKVYEWNDIRVISSAKNFALIYYDTESQEIQNISFARLDSPR